MKFELFRQIFKKEILKYQISWLSVHCEPGFSIETYGQAGRTDSRDDANSR